ncbi:sialidase family protein [Psychrobacter sp.]|uniref:sialidase family protein n=1 Tax=Psychrobacter sp. TaxID=56811 RepID=UPI002FDA28E6
MIDSSGALTISDVITNEGSFNAMSSKSSSDANISLLKITDYAIAARDDEPLLLTTDLFTAAELSAVFAFGVSLCRISKKEYLAFCESRMGGDFGVTKIVARRLIVNSDYTTALGAVTTVCDTGIELGQPYSSLNPASIKVLSGAHAGRVYLYYIKTFYNNDRNETFYKYSDNDGVTWSEEVSMTPFIPKMNEWKVVAVGTGKAIQLRYGTNAGRIILPCWRGDAAYPSSQAGLKSFILYSDDGGVNYTVGAESNIAGSNECQVAELENGDILLLARDATNIKKTEISKDGGITLQDQKSLTNIQTDKVQSGLCQFKNSFDLSVPKLIISTPSKPWLREDMALYGSYDGRSFSLLKVIDTGVDSYSDILPIDESHILVAYSKGDGGAPDKKIVTTIVNLKSLFLGV